MSLRVFELAKELNIPTKELIKRIKVLGIEITGNFSALADEQITDIRKNFLEPATRIKESLVSGEEGPKRVRRRIISAKKATEGRKIKESLKLDDAPLEKDVETRKQMSAEETEEETVKKPKKIIRKKAVEPVDEVVEETEEQKPEPTKEVKEEKKRTPAKDIRRRIMRAAQNTAEPKVVTLAEIKAEKKAETKKAKEAAAAEEQKVTAAKKSDEIAETVQKPSKETETSASKAKKADLPADEKKPGTTKKEKKQVVEKGKKSAADGEKAAKPKKPGVVADAENRTLAKEFARKEKAKIDPETIPDPLEEIGGELESQNLPSVRPGKFMPKKRFSKSSRRKDRNRKQKITKKEVHTFNPRQKDLVVGEFITVGDLAGLIGIKVPQIIKTLMSLSIMATITQSIDGETAVLVAGEHNVDLKVEFDSIEDGIDQIVDQTKNLQLRSPVVTIMGHVDHGKTSLLDMIRSTNVIGGEAGGITQHIGAYHVKTAAGHITFLDTPGHAAFTAMRARGADVTDIVVLVVAADDGPRPQTVEAIDHAKAAGVQIIVAINKCDKPDANPDRTIQQLMEHELVPEEFGGDVPMIKVSAKSGEGIDKLLEMLHLQSEIMELKADPDRLAQGVVIESKIDKGRGNTATILIQTGTLKIGDNYVVGTEYGRVRAMWNDRGRKLNEAFPSVPVEIVGLNGVPMAGDRFNVGQDEKQVRQIATLRSEKEKAKKQAQQHKRSLENLLESMGKDEQRILNLIIKTDVIGSLEALSDALYRLGNEQVAIRVIRGAVGAITSTDVLLASTSDAVMIGFNTRPDASAKKLSVEENVDVRTYSIIYEVIDDVKKALEGMLEPIIREEIQGKAEVLEVFNIPKVGVIAGTKVTEGKFVRDCPVRVIRDNVIIHNGKLSSLKRFKDQAKEVMSGFECGIGIDAYKDIKVGDELESYSRLETAAKL
ncbi:MAG: translation initiation factor IF-2 [Deltaproteobacteria bacterium]|nr:translation initiation factor IF-2 [Deltaproteobacteria bacterium]MBT4267249.1 translation initiation factor IF-2 [Deltaproteobacteria bacterium]MBT4639341.1 translation initiation factor IF-2 [Deltaproteobacteria bacterium]MBT6504655.1 translation initiation factor IF-2 [Deltaproteobacteria bacterium]MBT6611516.1 translation initiation factor IF-2 [Deltaproteobacteria bacterium]